MKFILMSFLYCFSSWGVSLSTLDQRQRDLKEDYLILQEELPTYQQLIELSQDDKSLQLVKESVIKMEKFFKSYDQFNLDKIDYFYETTLKKAKDELALYESDFGRAPKKVYRALHDFESSIETYKSKKLYFGTEKDTERLDIAHEILHHYGKFAKKLKKAQGENTWRRFGDPKILPFIDKPSDFLKVTKELFQILWSSYVNYKTGIPDKAPIPEALQGYQRKLVNMRHVQTKWEGLDNLGSIEHDGKTLHMFLINHANSYFDSSAQQAFPVKGMSAMGNVEIFFPSFLAKRMVKSDHMITVGHGDTTGKTIELVRKKQLNRFFLAIEGLTGTGLYEMRPVMPLFNEAVYDSIQRGLKLRLHPVAFPDNFRLLNDWRAPIEGDKLSRGVLMPAIENETCVGLLKATGSKNAIGIFIRWMWFQTLKINDLEVLAMPYPSTIEKDLNRMIWENE